MSEIDRAYGRMRFADSLRAAGQPGPISDYDKRVWFNQAVDSHNTDYHKRADAAGDAYKQMLDDATIWEAIKLRHRTGQLQDAPDGAGLEARRKRLLKKFGLPDDIFVQ